MPTRIASVVSMSPPTIAVAQNAPSRRAGNRLFGCYRHRRALDLVARYLNIAALLLEVEPGLPGT
jgi:hypothetical protein